MARRDVVGKVDYAGKTFKNGMSSFEATTSFRRDGITYYIEVNDMYGTNTIATWWDDSDNGFGYNNYGYVYVDNPFNRMTGSFSPENIDQYLGVNSAYDRNLPMSIKKAIINRVKKYIDYDALNDIRRSQRTESIGRRSNKLKISEGVYEITYDYDDEWSGGGTSSETFEGSWSELQDYIKQLRASGCYNIDAACVDDCYESYSGLTESSDGGVVIKTDSKEGKYYLTKSSTKQKTFWSTDIKKANVFAKKDSAMNKLYTVLQKLPENAFYDEDTAFDLEDESELKGAKFAKFYITDTSGKEIEDISKEVKDHLLSDDKFISSIFDEDMDESYSRLNEGSEEIARKLFVSLVKLYPYGYSVLNDGNFVCRIAAKDDEDAIRQFNDFLKTDWKSAWRNGTLPKYFGESKKRVFRKHSRMTERIFPDQYQSNVDGKTYTIKWHDGKGKYYVQIPCARKVLWSDSPEELMGQIDDELKKCYRRESYRKLREQDVEIDVKHEGILEVPEGKNVDDLPLSHFEKLAKKKGLSKITKALNNLQVWNKNDDPKLSKWAGDMIDKLNKKLKKDEAYNSGIETGWKERTIAVDDDEQEAAVEEILADAKRDNDRIEWDIDYNGGTFAGSRVFYIYSDGDTFEEIRYKVREMKDDAIYGRGVYESYRKKSLKTESSTNVEEAKRGRKPKSSTENSVARFLDLQIEQGKIDEKQVVAVYGKNNNLMWLGKAGFYPLYMQDIRYQSSGYDADHPHELWINARSYTRPFGENMRRRKRR